jgi:hypothetical protein
MRYVETVVRTLVQGGARKVVKYVSPTEVVRATRRLSHGKIARGNATILLTLGKPNHAEREFIKACKAAGEPFPVKRLQIKLPPKRRK